MIKKISGLFLFLLLLTGIVYAQDSMNQNNRPSQGEQEEQEGQGMRGPGHRPPRIPPQFAIDACVGKSEGATCEVSTPEGTRTGDCAYTPDQKYFACRPERMSEDRGGPPDEEQGERSDHPQEQQEGI